jgi:PPM family protein phosphatase
VTSSHIRQSNPGRGDVIVHVFGRTDVGRTREHNEDSFVVADLTTGNATLHPEVRTHVVGERGTLFMVADGMGGAAAGELASEMAVDVVLEQLREHWATAMDANPETFARVLRSATETANERIHRFASENTEHRGMGTTATIAGMLEDTLYLAQVGDSRAYLVRNGAAFQITKDQSLMQRLVEAGELTEEEAEQSERRNIILQALGPEAAIRTDVTHQRVCRGDTLILCSDGLSGQVKGDEIARAVTEERDLVEVCRRLIDLANESGGPDNITVIAARFEGDGLSLPGDGDAVGHSAFRFPGEPVDSGEVPNFKAAERSSRATVRMSNPDVPPEDTPQSPRTPSPDSSRKTVELKAGPERSSAPFMIAAAVVIVAAVAVLIYRYFLR